MIKTMKCELIVKNGNNSINIELVPGSKLTKRGYGSIINYLADEFDVSKKYVEGVIKDVKESNDAPKQISGFYIGNGRFTFSRYLTDEPFARKLVEAIFNNSVDILNKKYIENI
jgi:hypothetical protein